VANNTNNLDQVTFSIGENEPDDDHKPHQLFCEMDELQSFEWKESARWLKFEEDVENGGRWSKPHVATLSLHSLMELRSCLVNGANLLDFPGEDLLTIVDGLLDHVIKAKLLNEDHRESVKNALLLKHVHQHEKEFQKQASSNGEKKPFPLIKSLADIGKKLSHVDMRGEGRLFRIFYFIKEFGWI
jgi:sodium bicarbonate cotransporter 7